VLKNNPPIKKIHQRKSTRENPTEKSSRNIHQKNPPEKSTRKIHQKVHVKYIPEKSAKIFSPAMYSISIWI